MSISIWSKSTDCVTVIFASFPCSVESINKLVTHSVISSVSSTAFINAQAAPTFVASVTSAQSSTFKWLNIAVLFTHNAIVPVVVIGEPLSTSNQSDQEIATLVTVQEPQVALIIGFNGSVLSTVIHVQATTLCTQSQVSHTGIAGTV